MAASKELTLCLILLLSPWASTGALSGGGDPTSLPCLQKLMPCTPYLRSSTPPTPACCVPLKQEIDSDVGCLCELLNNDAALKTFNVTKADVIKFPQRCQLPQADLSKCSNSTDTKVPPPPGPVPSNPATPPQSPPKGSSANSAGLGERMIRVVASLVFSATFLVSVIF